MTNWKQYKLGEVLQFGNGKVRPQSEGGIPVYGGNGILDYCNETNYNGETIVIGRVGAYCGAVYYENKPIWVSDNALSAKPKSGFNAKFLFYYLKNLELNQFAEGSSHPLVTQSLLNSIDVVVTNDKTEQSAIASILTSLDNKIDLLHRQNKTLEQLAETLFRQWFVEEAEETWEKKTVSEIIDVRDGTHDSPKQVTVGMHLITSRHLKPTGIDFDNAYKISERDFTEINKRSKVDINDILFSMIGTLGLIHLVVDEPNFAIKNMGLFKCSEKPWFSKFLYLLLRSSIGQKFIHESADGSTQEYITLGSLRALQFSYPKEDRIKEFNTQIEPMFQKIKSNTTQIRTLTQLRDTLLPKLMSGEVRVAH
jgi:type I restriction enzyme S subunit